MRFPIGNGVTLGRSPHTIGKLVGSQAVVLWENKTMIKARLGFCLLKHLLHCTIEASAILFLGDFRSYPCAQDKFVFFRDFTRPSESQ